MSSPLRRMEQHRGLRRDHIAIHPMTAGGWRILDKRMVSTGMDCVLGFVARRGDVFEVVRIDQPFSRSYCAKLSDAVAIVLRPHSYHPWIPHFAEAAVTRQVALAA